MLEGISLVTILVIAVAFAIRPWYKALTGKHSGCANCPGRCGHTAADGQRSCAASKKG